MITLADIFEDLSHGELSQLSMGNFLTDEFEQSPDPKSYARLISALNLALKKLYGRFLVSAKELTITQFDAVELYICDSDYAVSGGTQSNLYITDTVALPFKDDILKIEQVYDEDGNELFLNQTDEAGSLFTPNYRTVQIPKPVAGNTTLVQYRAKHAKVEWTLAIDPVTYEIEIPEALYEPMLLYIAYRVFSGVPISDGNNASTDFLAKYEQSCQQVEKHGLFVQPSIGGWRFDDRGWK